VGGEKENILGKRAVRIKRGWGTLEFKHEILREREENKK